jgi:hypothetical protein
MKNVKTKLVLIVCVVFAAAFGHPAARASSAPAGFETRCGWFSNPTPANIWFYDRGGEWAIGVQPLSHRPPSPRLFRF